jgi:hypothetical protein
MCLAHYKNKKTKKTKIMKSFFLSIIALFAVLTTLFAEPNIPAKSPKDPEAIYPTKYIVEHFTASTCAPCVGMNFWMGPMYKEKHAEGKLIYIKYPWHFPAPGDPYYVAADGGVRSDYYGVRGVPTVLGNAVVHDAPSGTPYSELVASLATKIDEYVANTMSAYDIRFDSAYLSSRGDGKTNIRIKYTIIPNTAATVRVHTVVFQEKTTGNRGNNGETEFFHSVMKMLPNGHGNSVSFEKGVSQTFTYEQDINATFIEEIVDGKDLGLVVFLQNHTTKQILGAAERKIDRSNVVAPVITSERVGDSALITITAATGPIHVSLTGSHPTASSPVYTEPFWINRSTTIRAITMDGEWASNTTTLIETFVAETPIVEWSTYGNETWVKIISPTEGAAIHFNINNLAPTTNHPIYTDSFRITQNTRVRAIAAKSGWTNSPPVNIMTILGENGSTPNQNLMVFEGLKVYPNPADDYVNIEYAKNAKLFLFNINGVLVYEGTVNGHKRLSLERYPSGTYLLRIVSDDGTATERVVKR